MSRLTGGPEPVVASGEAEPAEFQRLAADIEREVSAVIVGEDEAVRGVLICALTGSHALLEGVPGVGKTRLALSFAQALALDFKRIQFTPDLMPADITGTNVLMEDDAGATGVRFEPGPLFANLVLADEINRATPKTQSALLEAMQERTITTATTTRPLPRPFCVLATQNPVEMHGTYPLPEAQLDRFLLKLRFDFPSTAQLTEIVERTEAGDEHEIRPVADAAALLRMVRLVRRVPATRDVLDYVSQLIVALQPSGQNASPLVREYVRLGPSPRGAQALALAGRVTALLAGRLNLAYEDVRSVAMPALRHRVILGFDAERDGIDAESIIGDVLQDVDERAA